MKIGDKVLKINLKYICKYGGKTQHSWIGNFVIQEIDHHNRITLKDNKTNRILKRKYA